MDRTCGQTLSENVCRCDCASGDQHIEAFGAQRIDEWQKSERFADTCAMQPD